MLGLIPVVAIAVVSVLVYGLVKSELLFAQVAYGAVILSFLGGVHWGLAITDHQLLSGKIGWWVLGLSVIPALIGWLALMPQSRTGLLMLVSGFIFMLWIDVRVSIKGNVPPWYPTLRWRLTLVVLVSLILTMW
jgi:hypothetical protein